MRGMFEEDGLLTGPEPAHPSSGPPGHLLPQGEKEERPPYPPAFCMQSPAM